MSILIAPNPRTYTLHIDGEERTVKKIGKGQFTTAYSDGSTVFLIVADGCYDKDMAVELHNTFPNPYFPAVEKAGYCGERTVYRCPLYGKLTAAHQQAWLVYKTIKGAHDSTRAVSKLHGTYDGYEFNQRVLDKLTSDALVTPNFPDGALSALQTAVDFAADFGSEYWLDIGRVNFAVNGEQLIFLDLFCNAVALNRR